MPRDITVISKAKTVRALRPVRRTNQELREISLKSISEAALALFVEKGYGATSIEQVALAANLTKGGIYFYVEKKEDLLTELLDEISRDYLSRMNLACDATGKTPNERLALLINIQGAFSRERPQELMLLVKSSIELKSCEQAPGRLIKSFYRKFASIVSAVIDDGKESGAFHTTIPTRELASFYMSAHDGMTLEWYRRGSKIIGRELVRAFRETMTNGIK